MGMWRRLANLLRRERVDAEIEAELRAHMEMAIDDAVRAGMAEPEARRMAQLRFGNPLAMRERTAGSDTAATIEQIWNDLRQALRQLRRSPAFTATAVITLALGIGATTANFTLIQQVMLQPLAVVRPDQLWRIGDAERCCPAEHDCQSD